MNHWLLKSEPSVYSIDHLQQSPEQRDHWDGIRNYQARNFIRDRMQIGDLCFFYHSNCKCPGIVGIVEIVSAAYPDFTAFDPQDIHFDPKSQPSNPRWYMVDVRFQRKLSRMISLQELKQYQKLMAMPLLKRGNRLSIMPVATHEWRFILSLESVVPSR